MMLIILFISQAGTLNSVGFLSIINWRISLHIVHVYTSKCIINRGLHIFNKISGLFFSIKSYVMRSCYGYSQNRLGNAIYCGVHVIYGHAILRTPRIHD